MGAFRIEQRWADYYAILHGDRRVAILTPARPALEWPEGIVIAPAEPWSIIPDPEAFPDAGCAGLPAPLVSGPMDFGSYEAVARFLGLASAQVAA